MVRDNMKKFFEEEKGDILIMFAVAMSTIFILVGLSTDVILAISKKAKIEEVVGITQSIVFDLGEELWNSQNPEYVYQKIAEEIAEKNGIARNQVRVTWIEGYVGEYRREAISEIVITDTYETVILKMFGINELPIRVKKGSRQYKSASPVWRP